MHVLASIGFARDQKRRGSSWVSEARVPVKDQLVCDPQERSASADVEGTSLQLHRVVALVARQQRPTSVPSRIRAATHVMEPDADLVRILRRLGVSHWQPRMVSAELIVQRLLIVRGQVASASGHPEGAKSACALPFASAAAILWRLQHAHGLGQA